MPADRQGHTVDSFMTFLGDEVMLAPLMAMALLGLNVDFSLISPSTVLLSPSVTTTDADKLKGDTLAPAQPSYNTVSKQKKRILRLRRDCKT